MDAPGNHSSCATVGNLFSSALLPDSAQQSTLSDLLRTNSITPDLSYFRSIIASSGEDIARYDREIRTLRAVLEKAVAERDTLQFHADGCRSVLAPIRSLPPEILLKIFTFCSQPPHSDDIIIHCMMRNPQKYLEELAKGHLFQLSRVCSMWRAAVMGTPSLWATIDAIATWDFTHNSVAQVQNDLLSAVVERSGNCPLRVTILAATRPRETPGLELLAQCSERWQTANLRIDDDAAFRHLSSAKGKFSLLESLHIPGVWQLDLFEVAPRLTQVTLRGYIAAQPPKLPWENLRALNYENGSTANVRAFMSLIHRCTSLASVHFTKLDVSALSLPLDLPAIASSINSFGITLKNSRDSSSTHSTRVFSDIIQSFTLPSARQLDFCMSLTPLFWPQHDFLSFASRSSFRDTVTSLALRNIIIMDVELLDCLKDLPHLRTLAITDIPKGGDTAFGRPLSHAEHIVATDNLLRQLVWMPDAACIVPRLQVFRCTSLFRFITQVLLDFVVSRVQPGRTAEARFELQMRGPPEHTPVLDATLSTELTMLRRRGDIWYSMEASQSSVWCPEYE